MKYVPGMALDFVESDVSGVRIGGLDPKYSTFTMDGNRIAGAGSSFGAGSRAATFDAMSVTGIETFKVSYTLTAHMEADAAAGNIEMHSKNALERKGLLLSGQAYAVGTSDALTLGKKYFPDDRRHSVILPSGRLDYSDVFLQHRLGIALGVSYNASFVEQDQQQVQYDYSNPARPVITGIMWRAGPKVPKRSGTNFSADFRATPDLMFSLRSAYTWFGSKYNNLYTWLRANTAQIDPSSTLTHVVANATTNANTRLGTEYSVRSHYGNAYTLAPKFEYKKGSWTLTGGASYSQSIHKYQDRGDGFFKNTNSRITRMSWQADRSDPSSHEWILTQRSGPDWSVPENWGSRDTHGSNVVSTHTEGRNEVISGNLDVKKKVILFGLPFELMSGVRTRLNTYSFYDWNEQWTYVGPTGNQLTSPVLWDKNYRFDPHMGGNVAAQGWRVDDVHGMAALYREHPEYFVADSLGNFTRQLISPRSVKEQIDAAYAEATTRWEKLRLNGGLRAERTRTLARVWDPLPRAALVAAGYPVNAAGAPTTSDGVLYQYHNGQRSSHYGDYSNLFLSGGGKYSFLRNLEGQLAMSESILRPDYPNLGGITSVDETNAVITSPNSGLKPERATKYFTRLQYYFEPAGTLGVSAYVLDVKDKQLTGRSVDPAQVPDYGTDPNYQGYRFVSTVNLPGTQRTEGISVEYTQRLVFLPGLLKDLSVFGSLTRNIADRQLIGNVPKSANGGVRFHHGRIDLQVRSTWSSSKLVSIGTTTNGYVWEKERVIGDASATYTLNRHVQILLSLRNLFNTPSYQYSNEPGRMFLYQHYGVLWNLGVKGTF
jgi:TonB-dependent receptor